MVIYNIRRQNTCYNIVFVCASTRRLSALSTHRGGEMSGLCKCPQRGNVRHPCMVNGCVDDALF